MYEYEADQVLWKKKDSFILREIKRIVTILTMPWKFEVIHYNFGTTVACPPPPFKPGEGFFNRIARAIYFLYSSILQCWELSMLKALGRPMFVHYQGDDARQGSFSQENFKISIASQVDEGYYNPHSDAFKKRSINRMARYCHTIYALNPDLLHVLPKGAKFTPYCHLDLSEWSPVYPSKTDRPLRIGHAPSHRKVKGTQLIIDALDSLRESGYSFEFVLVEGVSNREARKIYETIDILVDQLFAGWYGGLAVEAMALGKPVVVYLRDEDLKFVPEQMTEEFPFIRVCPETVRDGLKKVLNMSNTELSNLSRQSRAYVEKWHDPISIVDGIKRDYEKALGKKIEIN